MGNTNGEKVKVIVEEWKNYFAAHYNPSEGLKLEELAQISINVLVDWEKRELQRKD